MMLRAFGFRKGNVGENLRFGDGTETKEQNFVLALCLFCL
jgi:hypothetical protein